MVAMLIGGRRSKRNGGR